MWQAPSARDERRVPLGLGPPWIAVGLAVGLATRWWWGVVVWAVLSFGPSLGARLLRGPPDDPDVSRPVSERTRQAIWLVVLAAYVAGLGVSALLIAERTGSSWWGFAFLGVVVPAPWIVQWLIDRREDTT